MKLFLLFLLLFTGMTGQSLPGDKSDSYRIKKGQEKRKHISGDSIIKKLQQMKDSAEAAMKTAEKDRVNENLSRNMDGILQLQKEQKARQKKAAVIRIAIGVAFLAILIIGWRRRRK